MLNPEKIWHDYLTDLSTSPARCSHFTLGNPKSHISTLLFIYFRLPQMRTYSNCCTTALAVYLLLFSASYYLHSPSTASGTHYKRTGGARVLVWTCCGLWQRLVATWAEFQHCVVYYVTDQCRKRLEACINAEGGHSEHLLWQCLPDIKVATHHNRFSSEPPMPQPALRATNIWRNTRNLQSDEKVFTFHKLVWWHFTWGGQVGYSLFSSGITLIIKSMYE